jgi:copper chaperone
VVVTLIIGSLLTTSNGTARAGVEQPGGRASHHLMNERSPMSAITYSVPAISCGHCRTAITHEVSAVAGVAAVDVELETKTVTVTGDPLDEAAIVAAIDEAGYEVAP